MNQSATFPISEKKTNSDERGEKKAFLKSGPSQMILEIIDPNKKKISAFIDGRVTTWRALPSDRKCFIALLSFSALLSVTTLLIATGIARRITRKRATRVAAPAS